MKPATIRFSAFIILLINVLKADCVWSQNIGVNNPTPDPSAVLDVTSTDKGLLVPRVPLVSTLVPLPITAPATGLLIFNTATAGTAPNNVTPGFYFWDGTKWNRFDSGNLGKDWSIDGNAGTNPAVNFIGTTDNVDLVFKRNNLRAGLLGVQNTSFGNSSLNSIIAGTANNAFGLNALLSNTNGSFNNAFGVSSLSSNTTGSFNVGIGHRALFQNTTGNSNTAIGINALRSNVSGSNSVAVGDSALHNNQVSGNTAIGSKAGFFNSMGARNTLIGFESGFNLSTASGNTALGHMTLRSGNGQNNVAIGDSAMFSNGVGSNNVVIGNGAGVNFFLGNLNTFVGSFTGRSIGNGSFNTFVGAESGKNSTGQFNSFFGHLAGANVTVGESNVIIGQFSGNSLTSGNKNTILGRGAGDLLVSGSNNTILGADAEVASGVSNSTAIGSNAAVQGSNQVVIGSVAGLNGAASSVNVGIGTINPTHRLHLVGNFRFEDGNQGNGKVLVGDAAGQAFWANLTAGQVNAWGLTGNSGTNANTNFMGTIDNVDVRFRRGNLNSGLIGETNTAFGTLAFQAVVPNNNNTAIGALAMNAIVNGNNNTAVGFSAMSSVFGGSNNSAFGHHALAGVTSGFSNVALGVFALSVNTTASNSVAVGDSALRFNITSGNTAIGSKAGLSNTTGARNTFAGFNAGRNNTVGSSNTFIGNVAGFNLSTGSNNLAIGDSALFSSVTSILNVAIGPKAARNLLGSNNLMIGASAGANTTIGSSNVFIGNESGANAAAGNNNVFIGAEAGRNNNSSNNTFVGFNAGIAAGGQNNVLVGFSAGSNFQGSGNIAIGHLAGSSLNTTGSENIYLGRNTADQTLLSDNSVAIGNNATFSASNVIVLGAVSGQNTAAVTPNIGIGTSNPVRRFHVRLNGASGGTPNGNAVAFFENNSSAFLHMMTPDANENGLLFGRPSNSIGGAIIYNNISLADGFQFRTGGNATRMVLDAAGNLGVGVTAPTRRLHVRFNGASGAASLASAVGLFENNGSAFVQILTPDADESGLAFGKPSNFFSGGIVFNNTSMPNGFQFRTGGNFTRMVLDAGGNVGIGVVAPAERLEVAGNVNSTNGDFYGGALNGVINMGGGIMNPLINIIADATPTPLNADGDEDLYIADDIELGGQGFKPGGGSWATASDARLKKDVQPFSDGLDKVLAIKPVSFKYNDKFRHLDNGKTYVGVIAQEIKEVAPYTVELTPFGQVKQEDENGVERIIKPGEEFYSYDSSALTYMLINAVKELKNMNDEQNRTIEALKTEIERLKISR